MKKIVVTIEMTEQEKKEMAGACENVNLLFSKKDDLEMLHEANAVIGNVPCAVLNDCPYLEWVHLESAGSDRYNDLKDSIIVTNSSGAYGQAIGEHMLATTMYFYKRLDQYVPQQKEHTWKNLGKVDSIQEAKILIVGLGDIGKTYAKMMHGLGATVYGIKRRVNQELEYVEKIYTLDALDSLLPQMDVVALCLPKTEDTSNVLDESHLRLMKKTAVLLNVGRGNAIDTVALMKVLEEGYFKGVSLDVTNPEPLPRNNKLWNYPNVLITPHVSGNYNMDYTFRLVQQIAIKNINHYVQEEPLEHLVDRSVGY